MEDHDELIKYILENILGKYMIKYKTSDYYPVVVGGSTFHHCKPNTVSIPVSDIDIVFVTDDPKPSIRKINAMKQSRKQFISEITNDSDLAAHNIKLDIDLIYKRKPDLKRLVAIKLIRLKYNDYVVFDISIQHPGINRFLGKYPIISKHIIPYEEKNGILWAKCTYVKYEIVRILLHYHYMFRNHETHHLRIKSYIKYIYKIHSLLDIPIYIKPIPSNINQTLEILYKNPKFKRIQNKLQNKISDLTSEAIILDN